MSQEKKKLLKYLMMPIALVCFAFQVHAQNLNVTGKVIDATSSNSIDGASVSVKNGKSTLTNAAGSFTISAAKGTSVTISSIGYQSATVTVNGTELLVKLIPSV